MLLVSLVSTNYGRRHFKIFSNCHVSWDTLYIYVCTLSNEYLVYINKYCRGLRLDMDYITICCKYWNMKLKITVNTNPVFVKLKKLTAWLVWVQIKYFTFPFLKDFFQFESGCKQFLHILKEILKRVIWYNRNPCLYNYNVCTAKGMRTNYSPLNLCIKPSLRWQFNISCEDSFCD